MLVIRAMVLMRSGVRRTSRLSRVDSFSYMIPDILGAGANEEGKKGSGRGVEDPGADLWAPRVVTPSCFLFNFVKPPGVWARWTLPRCGGRGVQAQGHDVQILHDPALSCPAVHLLSRLPEVH